MSKARGLAWVVVVCAAAAATVPALPWLAGHVPWSVERFLAGVLGGAPGGEVCARHAPAAAQAAFDRLVARIYPIDARDAQVPITVTVLRGKAINAFATLGGHIYVFDGLIRQARSPEELAGVLAHEIAHVRQRHVIEGIAVSLATLGAVGGTDPSAASRMATVLLTMTFSRTQEAEADRDGLERLRRAQVDAAGFADFFDRAAKSPEPPAFLSSHPGSAERAALAAQYRGYGVRPLLDAAAWKAIGGICG